MAGREKKQKKSVGAAKSASKRPVTTMTKHAVRGAASFAQSAKPAAKGSASIAQFALLRRPLITEKSAGLSADRNRVVFRVASGATKTEIRAAVEAVYGVRVAAVRTLNMMGKVKRAGNSIGRRASFKKAYVTLREGQTIDVVEGL